MQQIINMCISYCRLRILLSILMNKLIKHILMVKYLFIIILQIHIKQQMNLKNTNNISQQMKAEIQNLSSARQSIQKSKDISGSMVNLSQTMSNLKPLMDKQSSYIKNFLQSQDVSNASSQQSQLRRYANRIFDITLNEINQLLSQAQNYFSLQMKSNWKKIINQIQKQLSIQKQKLGQGNSNSGLMQFLFKTINIKDKLIKQFVQSIIYRKILLCKDLNIIESGYVHSEKKFVNHLIETYNLDKGFVPTKPIFKQFNFQIDGSQGSWSLTRVQNKSSHISQFFKVVNIQIQQIFSIIRNYANLNQQQRNKSQIKRNDQQVMSLRDQIEIMNKNYYNLEKKYRDAVSKDEKLDMTELKQRLREAQETIQNKDSQIKQLKNQFRDSSNHIQMLKEKVSDLTSDLNKVNQLEMRKLKQLQINQGNLNMQFSRIYQNIKNFGNIFQFQNDGKKSLAKQIIAQKNTVQKMVDMLGLQKRKNMQLKSEIQRLNQVILELGQRLKLKRIQDSENSLQ